MAPRNADPQAPTQTHRDRNFEWSPVICTFSSPLEDSDVRSSLKTTVFLFVCFYIKTELSKLLQLSLPPFPLYDMGLLAVPTSQGNCEELEREGMGWG